MRIYEGDGIEFELRIHKKSKRAKAALPGKLFIPEYRDIEHILCPVTTLEQYLIATGRLGAMAQDDTTVVWESDPILRKTTSPHTGVTPKTVSKWITNTINEAENLPMSTSVMGHSTRSKAAQTAFEEGISVKEIMESADWKSEAVFKNHYHQPGYSKRFGRAVLGTVG